MKIVAVRSTRLRVPLQVPVSAAIGSFSAVGYLLVELRADDGRTGSAHLTVPDGTGLAALDALLQDLQPLVLGQDPRDTLGLWQRLQRAGHWLGPAGAWSFVMSALDMACWDLAGQHAGLPLQQLWGSTRETVPVYGSGRMWLAQPLGDIVAEARGFVASGFRALKMRVGSEDLRRDVERVQAVRDAVGPSIALMVDGNQCLGVARAVSLAHALQPLNIAWLEEPVPAQDVWGMAEVRRRSSIPLAAGENLYTAHDFRALFEAGAVDIVMPDLQRVGGYTGLRRIAEAAAQRGITTSPHAFAWASAACMAALPEPGPVEWMPRGDLLYGRTTQLAPDGALRLPDGAGSGLRFDPGFVERHRVGP